MFLTCFLIPNKHFVQSTKEAWGIPHHNAYMQIVGTIQRTNYFFAIPEHPYHLSVGAVAIDQNNAICCHHFPYADVYLLMRETVLPEDTIEATLSRGLLDEFGARSKIITYIGAQLSSFKVGQKDIEKTTLYFVCKLLNRDDTWRKFNDREGNSKIVCRDIDFLIPKMKEQAYRLNQGNLDESTILKRVKEMLAQKAIFRVR